MILTRFGVIFGFLSVLLGAFGAHYVELRLEPRLLKIYMTAIHYLWIHAIAIIAYKGAGGDTPALRREFDGVAQEIDGDLFDLSQIAMDER